MKYACNQCAVRQSHAMMAFRALPARIPFPTPDGAPSAPQPVHRPLAPRPNLAMGD